MQSRMTIVGAVVFVCHAAQATEVYKWTDDKGQTHYGRTVPEDQKSKARPIDLSNARPMDGQRQGTTTSRDKVPADPEKQVVAPVPRPAASGAAAGSRPSPAANSCQHAWKTYHDSIACFHPYRLTNGGVKPEAFNHCVQIARPDICNEPANTDVTTSN